MESYCIWKVGHAHTMVIYTMGGLGGVGEVFFNQLARGRLYCIAIQHDLVLEASIFSGGFT